MKWKFTNESFVNSPTVPRKRCSIREDRSLDGGQMSNVTSQKVLRTATLHAEGYGNITHWKVDSNKPYDRQPKIPPSHVKHVPVVGVMSMTCNEVDITSIDQHHVTIKLDDNNNKVMSDMRNIDMNSSVVSKRTQRTCIKISELLNPEHDWIADTKNYCCKYNKEEYTNIVTQDKSEL